MLMLLLLLSIMRPTATTAESVTQTITVIVPFWNNAVYTVVIIVSIVVGVVLVIVTYKGTSFIVIITQR